MNEKNYSLRGMEHWVHNRIVDLIKNGNQTRTEIARRLGISDKTLQRRMGDGTWTLTDILGIEAVYGVSLLSPPVKNGLTSDGTVPDDAAGRQHSQLPYRIKIEIDASSFRPQDMDQLNHDLTETLKHIYKRRN